MTALPTSIQRANALLSTPLPHPKFEQAYAEIMHHFARSCDLRTRPGDLAKPEAMLLVGESNSGKTFLLKRCRDEICEREKNDDAALILSFAPRQTLEDFVGDFFKVTVGGNQIPNWRWEDHEKVEAIRRGIELSKVKIVFLDEAQHLTRFDEGTLQISDLLKSLIDACPVPFVLAGMPDLLKLKQHDQLRSRLRPSARLTAYRWDLQDDRISFIALLESLIESTKLPSQINFNDTLMASKFHFLSKGLIGNLTKFLSYVIELALTANGGCGSITIEALALAYEKFKDEQDDASPRALQGPLTEPVKRQSIQNPFLLNKKDYEKLWMTSLAAQQWQ